MTTRPHLTRKQALVLRAIGRLLEQNGYPPSMRELASELHLTPGTVHFHVHSLVRRGYLLHDGSDHGITILPGQAPPDLSPSSRLPLAGNLEAGKPLTLADAPVESADVPASLATSGSFVLRARGEALREVGILEGDHLVVHRQPDVEDGQLAVLTLPDGSATVRQVFRERGRFRLQAPGLVAEPVRVARVTVVGRLVGLVRAYPGL